MAHLKFKFDEVNFSKLYKVLSMKKREYKRMNVIVSELEMWNYLKMKHSKDADINLYEVIDEIINLEIEEFLEYRNR